MTTWSCLCLTAAKSDITAVLCWQVDRSSQVFGSLRDVMVSAANKDRNSSRRALKIRAVPKATKSGKWGRQDILYWPPIISGFDIKPMEVDEPMEDDLMCWSPRIPLTLQSTPSSKCLLRPPKIIFRLDDEPEPMEVDEPVEEENFAIVVNTFPCWEYSWLHF